MRSRWTSSTHYLDTLKQHVENPLWLQLGPEIYFTLWCRKNNLKSLASQGRNCVEFAFRPKSLSCYNMLVRSFVGFCVVMHLSLYHIAVSRVMYYLGNLARNGVTCNMIANQISAAKAPLVMIGLNLLVLSGRNVQYFLNQ